MEAFRPKIASDGLKFIVGLAILTWIFAIFGCIYTSVLFAVLTCFVIFFFRDPDPEIPEGDNLILAPAHGKVVSIISSLENDFLNKDMKRVSIFLSIFDCHINRSPCAGTIKSTKYTPGKFNLAFLNHASDENEKLSLFIKTPNKQDIILSLISGFLARRIVSSVKLGDNLKKSQRIGLIRFGSRVDIYLPDNVLLKVEKGDKVTGGETIIGEFI